ncbi:heavy metal-binding domain-containing protein [Apilactobacillus ozensis]|uniref:heavy metal-binding domain-containing protein n=1 Tax=Apilactobacillus ozensis TaxID=866801 RepID=UPI00200B263F|nr:heavy metal-binding domain-containing protein [Apilactobacillus ozensis]MCK8606992.1 heavy metal-binding domain-containing protein [Apilactobacillus ozensis]
MLTSTTENIGKKYKIIGTVFGSATQSRHVGSDIGAQVKNFFGGEIKGYTKMLQNANEKSIERLQNSASELGADAIVTIRFNSDSIGEDIQAITAYGTAVKFLE